MNFFQLYVFLFSILFFQQLKAQEITGTVIDGVTKEALIGVNIIIDGRGIASSDFDGKFTGTLEVKESLSLKSSSVTEGDVVTSKLIVESGAVFNAKCVMKTNVEVKSISDSHERIA